MNEYFPEKFLWGASTSAYQVEGDNKYCDWWECEEEGRLGASGRACDHYNRFKEDFSLAKELGHNSHRLGLEWSRLEKEEGVWDDNEWSHYKTVLDELLSLEIEPVLTLHHFTIPLWLKEKGGWENPESIDHFKRFAVKAIEELGGRVKYWITINEPNILGILAYFFGIWPPFRQNFNDALVVIGNLLKSHMCAYNGMKEYAVNTPGIQDPVIGLAKAVTAFHPSSPLSPLDRFSTCYRSIFHNTSFIESAIKGKVLIPGLKKEDLVTKNAADFIGLNYYFRQFIRHKKNIFKYPLGEVAPFENRPDAGEATDMGWEIYPRGIYEVAKKIAIFNKPLIITENGLATRNDSVRKKYIKDHLSQVLQAINSGINIIGYLHWSLLDNFEWAEGYSKRFGLIEVDFDTQKRTVRDSARYYASIIKAGKIV